MTDRRPAPPGVRVWAEAELPAGIARQIAELEAEAWPGSAPGHDPELAPKVMALVGEDGTVAASLALLFKDIRHAGRTYRAAGLSAVVTRSGLRGRGYGGRLVEAARHELTGAGAVDLVLFSCDRPLVPFYAAAGFTPLPGSVLVGGTPEDPLTTADPGFDKVVLAAVPPRSEDAVDLRVFRGARIGLYPGAVDRLW
ncbi:GNAT family N-acetyltransferase [Streptomyces venezuelae]|uniref:GNAT family N-acetyltransferase n=1 Tax=Streptomyces venezuelae TaxID=54571 RepID=A0A5P2DAT4_STRVZ|nr:GNAT family N-acetyltransferase [Streptomyces venezuelae]QES50381.1 GNAT family N-acetyltransferase [Streptomyces venezuelae]